MTDIGREFCDRLALQEEYLGSDKPVNKITPLVSVVTITYQHAPFIRQCLDSILAQETDFPYELVIGEDGSTDGTREICMEYAEKYPDRIRLFLRDRKLSQYTEANGRKIMFNGNFTKAAARGRFSALCEGDDYWIDKRKIQKQSDFLECNTDFVLCFTAYTELTTVEKPIFYNKRVYTKRDLIKTNIPATLTVMYRSEFNPLIYDDCLMGLWFGDWTLWMYLTDHGKMAYIDDVTATYRITMSGMARSTDYRKKFRDHIVFYSFLSRSYGDSYSYSVAAGTALVYAGYSLSLLDDKKYLASLINLWKSVLMMFSKHTVKVQINCCVKILLSIMSGKSYSKVKTSLVALKKAFHTLKMDIFHEKA